jgi:hypothetical protein
MLQSVIQEAIHAVSELAAFGGKIRELVFLWSAGAWLLKFLNQHFSGLLPADLVASVRERRMKSGDRSDRRQPDPNVGRYRVSDQWRCPPNFPAAA